MVDLFKREVWINENFKGALLNDARLSNRLTKIATKMANKPEGSIPQQMGIWSEIKACYEFLKNKKVTHKRIQMPHRQRVIHLAREIRGVVLFIQDSTELDYSARAKTEGLGQIGNQFGKGIMLHSCLAMKYQKNCELLGMAHQIIWERRERSQKYRIGDQLRKEKESVIWSQTLRAIGRAPKECKWITICDRGCDSYEYFCDLKTLHWEGVSRISQDRKIEVNEEKRLLKEWVTSLEVQGSKVIEIRKKGETHKRQIEIQIAWSEVKILPPKDVKEDKEIKLSVIRAWNEEENIEWILYSTIKVSNLEEAIEKVDWYSSRWTIEDYHKCLKTGCKIEKRQLETSKALEALVGILGIIAILLLCLRSLAREKSDEMASQFVPKLILKIICKSFQLDITTLSIGSFWRMVARMGGFINRKSDGEPGWQTLWRGWLRLMDMWEAIMLLDVREH
jgi:Transposase DNA-binding/Transposase DDE domain